MLHIYIRCCIICNACKRKVFSHNLTHKKSSMTVGSPMFSSQVRVNIKDIYRDMYDRKSKRVKIYDEILKRCQRRIVDMAKRDLYCMLFDVPEFVLTMPTYDLKTCIVYLIRNLRENGFYIRYYYPKILFVSWEEKHIQKHHVIEGTAIDIDHELKTLLHDPTQSMNLPAITHSSRNPANPPPPSVPQLEFSNGMIAPPKKNFPFKHVPHHSKTTNGKYVIHLD